MSNKPKISGTVKPHGGPDLPFDPYFDDVDFYHEPWEDYIYDDLRDHDLDGPYPWEENYNHDVWMDDFDGVPWDDDAGCEAVPEDDETEPPLPRHGSSQGEPVSPFSGYGHDIGKPWHKVSWDVDCANAYDWRRRNRNHKLVTLRTHRKGACHPKMRHRYC